MDNLTVEIVAFILVIAVILTVIGWVMELKIYQLKKKLKQVKTAVWEWRWRERRGERRGSSLEVADGVAEPAGPGDRRRILIRYGG